VRPDRNELGRSRWLAAVQRRPPRTAEAQPPSARTKPAITKLRSGVPDR